ncbi:MAG: hypothetical protein WBL55_24020, partial [Xanthobacteraceae bacterium]
CVGAGLFAAGGCAGGWAFCAHTFSALAAVLAGVGVKMKAAAKAETAVKITTTTATVPDGNLFRIFTPALWNSVH